MSGPARRKLPPPTREDVRAAYRLLLGREPEDEAVLDGHLAQTPSFSVLASRFTASPEFAARSRPQAAAPPPPLPIAAARLAVEVEASAEDLAAMLHRTGAYWTQIGREAPHWSVLTHELFTPDRIAGQTAAFQASGQRDADLVAGLLARHGIDPTRLPRCLEFGCGVGRATLKLAGLFKRVVGCDISKPHLDLAAHEAVRLGLGNVGWHRSTVAAPMPEGTWDVWYCRMVLQHNPPPVMAWVLSRAFAGLAPGGVAIFQVPTHRVGYGFAVAEYLRGPAPPAMEMHVLPQAEVFALAAAAGLRPLEVREDTYVVSSDPASWLSNLFVFRRPV